MLAALQDKEREGRAQRGPSCHAGLSSQPQEEAVCDPRCQHFTHSAALGAEPTGGTEPRAGVGNRQDAIAALQGLRSAGEMAKSIDTWMMETTEPCRQQQECPRDEIFLPQEADSSSLLFPFIHSIDQSTSTYHVPGTVRFCEWEAKKRQNSLSSGCSHCGGTKETRGRSAIKSWFPRGTALVSFS